MARKIAHPYLPGEPLDKTLYRVGWPEKGHESEGTATLGIWYRIEDEPPGTFRKAPWISTDGIAATARFFSDRYVPVKIGRLKRGSSESWLCTETIWRTPECPVANRGGKRREPPPPGGSGTPPPGGGGIPKGPVGELREVPVNELRTVLESLGWDTARVSRGGPGYLALVHVPQWADGCLAYDPNSWYSNATYPIETVLELVVNAKRWPVLIWDMRDRKVLWSAWGSGAGVPKKKPSRRPMKAQAVSKDLAKTILEILRDVYPDEWRAPGKPEGLYCQWESGTGPILMELGCSESKHDEGTIDTLAGCMGDGEPVHWIFSPSLGILWDPVNGWNQGDEPEAREESNASDAPQGELDLSAFLREYTPGQ